MDTLQPQSRRRQRVLLHVFCENFVASKKVLIFATEKVLLGSEGPSSTKAVYVA